MEDYKVGEGLEQTTSETFQRTGTHKSRGARSQWRLHFVRWCQILVVPQYGTCFVTHVASGIL